MRCYTSQWTQWWTSLQNSHQKTVVFETNRCTLLPDQVPLDWCSRHRLITDICWIGSKRRMKCFTFRKQIAHLFGWWRKGGMSVESSFKNKKGKQFISNPSRRSSFRFNTFPWDFPIGKKEQHYFVSETTRYLMLCFRICGFWFGLY